jgi:hypothetical protein
MHAEYSVIGKQDPSSQAEYSFIGADTEDRPHRPSSQGEYSVIGGESHDRPQRPSTQTEYSELSAEHEETVALNSEDRPQTTYLDEDYHCNGAPCEEDASRDQNHQNHVEYTGNGKHSTSLELAEKTPLAGNVTSPVNGNVGYLT